MSLNVSSPSPTPITVLARPSRINGARDPARSFPALPDDLLVYITPYLSYSELLRLSLASRHLHSMMPLHLAQFVCKNPEDVMKLGAYLYSDIGSRAPCLHSFALHLDQYPLRFGNLSRDLGDGIVDIVAVTKQLRYLRLDFSASPSIPNWFHHQPRLIEAIGSLPCLTYMYLSRPLWSDIANPSIYSSCLRELHLVDRYSGWFSVADLSQALSRVHTLETIVLQHVSFRATDPFDTHQPRPVHPLSSIQTVTLAGTELSYTVSVILPTLFPNLSTLNLVRSGFRWELNAPKVAVGFPSLHHISVAYAPQDAFLPFAVNRLTVVMDDKTGCHRVGCLVAPRVGLTLKTPPLRWHYGTYVDARYRWLELESDRVTLNAVMSQLTDAFAHPRSHSPLVCLSVLAPRSSQRSQDDGVDEEAQARFLRSAALCYPALKYVALAAPYRAGLDRDVDHAGERAPWRWWRVIRNEAGAAEEIQEFPAWEGERVRDYLRRADVEAVDAFADALIHPLSTVRPLTRTAERFQKLR